MKASFRAASAGIGSVAALALACAVAAQEPAATPEGESAAPAPAATDPSVLNAETMPLASRSLILDVADSSDRAIAVGERGHILVSESRRDWRQVENVPTRWNSSPRTSRPKLIAVRAPNQTAPIEQTTCASETTSITPPVCRM